MLRILGRANSFNVRKVSREALTRWRNRMLSVGQSGKAAMGVLFIVFGALIVSSLDKRVEAALVAVSPAWLT